MKSQALTHEVIESAPTTKRVLRYPIPAEARRPDADPIDLDTILDLPEANVEASGIRRAVTPAVVGSIQPGELAVTVRSEEVRRQDLRNGRRAIAVVWSMTIAAIGLLGFLTICR